MADAEGGGFAAECVAADIEAVGAGGESQIGEGREEAFV